MFCNLLSLSHLSLLRLVSPPSLVSASQSPSCCILLHSCDHSSSIIVVSPFVFFLSFSLFNVKFQSLFIIEYYSMGSICSTFISLHLVSLSAKFYTLLLSFLSFQCYTQIPTLITSCSNLGCLKALGFGCLCTCLDDQEAD